jgi:hypothetical protein
MISKTPKKESDRSQTADVNQKTPAQVKQPTFTHIANSNSQFQARCRLREGLPQNKLKDQLEIQFAAGKSYPSEPHEH